MLLFNTTGLCKENAAPALDSEGTQPLDWVSAVGCNEHLQHCYLVPKHQPISINQAKSAASFLPGRPSASEQRLVHGGEDKPETMFPQAFDTQHWLFLSSRSSLLPSYSSGCFLQLWVLSPSGLARTTRSPRNQRLFGARRSQLPPSKAVSLKTHLVLQSSQLSCSVPHRQGPAAQQPWYSNQRAAISRLSLVWHGLPGLLISAWAVRQRGDRGLELQGRGNTAQPGISKLGFSYILKP